MPIYPPRTEPIKKLQELTKRENELLFAMKKNVSAHKLIKFVDRYRQAQLSLLKAKIHQLTEGQFQKKPGNVSRAKLEKQIVEWTEKTSEAIIKELKNDLL